MTEMTPQQPESRPQPPAAGPSFLPYQIRTAPKPRRRPLAFRREPMSPKGNRIFILLSAAVGLGAIVVSVRPGIVADLLLLSIVLAFLAIPATLVLLAILYAIGVRIELPRPRVSGFIFALTTAVLVFAMIAIDSGPRAAFAVSRGAFEAQLAAAKSAPESRFIPNRGQQRIRVGLYTFDQCLTDPRGGTYFRVRTSDDMIDMFSHGFVLNPNPKGSPFGNAKYELTPLSDGWYIFKASDDY